MVLRQHSRIDLSLLQHRSTSEGKHWREAVETAGPFSAVSVTYDFAVDTVGHCISSVFSHYMA